MIALGCLAAGTAPAEDKPDTFEWVTQTVDEKFYDKKFAGVDWPAMKTKYRQRAARAASREQRAAIIIKCWPSCAPHTLPSTLRTRRSTLSCSVCFCPGT